MPLVQAASQVQVDASSGSTASITINGTVSGNALVFLGAIWDSNITWTITNTTDGGNTFTTREGNCTAAGNQKGRAVVAHASNITGGARTVVVNMAGNSGSALYYTIGCLEFSGVATSSAEDVQDDNSNFDYTTLDVNAGPITTTDAGDVLVGAATVVGSDATMNYASPPSWTNSYRENNQSIHQSIDAGYWIPGSIQTTYTAQWTHDNAAAEACGVVVALKPAGVGGASEMPRSRPFPFKPGSPRQLGLR